MELTTNEEKAILEKWEYPDHVVTCPRCGKELAYEEHGNSSVVKCPTDNCLFDTFRGI